MAVFLALDDSIALLPGDQAPRTVAILGFDGVATLDFIGPLEALKAARRYDNYHRTRACYDVAILGLTRKNFLSASGVRFEADRTIHEVSSLDTVIIPGGDGGEMPEVNRTVSSWLRRQSHGLRRIAAVRAGTFSLAESGLIDGRQVAAYWRHSQDLVRRFPTLRVNHTAAFVKDGDFYTCGGGTAAIEMTLALITEDYGGRVALSVAREFVVRLRPPGAEGPVISLPTGEWESTERLAELPAWILANLGDDLRIERLAERSCLCPRHFSRLFKRVYKVTPADFVEQLRIGEARRCLLQPGARINVVSASAGFKSPDAFRRSFERQLGVTPSSFQARFAVSAQARPSLTGRARRRARGQALLRKCRTS